MGLIEAEYLALGPGVSRTGIRLRFTGFQPRVLAVGVLSAVCECVCVCVRARVGVRTYSVCQEGVAPPWDVPLSFSDGLILCVSIPRMRWVPLLVHHYTSNSKFNFWTGTLFTEFKTRMRTVRCHPFSLDPSAPFPSSEALSYHSLLPG